LTWCFAPNFTIYTPHKQQLSFAMSNICKNKYFSGLLSFCFENSTKEISRKVHFVKGVRKVKFTCISVGRKSEVYKPKLIEIEVNMKRNLNKNRWHF
jgi:hypothetical protein